MLEMLKERKATLEARGKKGFTLMEMLIVIAIIAILIAIAIPVFTEQLGRADAGTDESNIRSGYAQVQSKIMLENNPVGNWFLKTNGEVEKINAGAGGVVVSPSADNASNFYVTHGTSASLTEDTSQQIEIAGIKNVKWSKNQYIYYQVEQETGGDQEYKISTISGSNAS